MTREDRAMLKAFRKKHGLKSLRAQLREQHEQNELARIARDELRRTQGEQHFLFAEDGRQLT